MVTARLAADQKACKQEARDLYGSTATLKIVDDLGPPQFVNWVPVCPRCGAYGNLKVVSFRLISRRKRYDCCLDLMPDGVTVCDVVGYDIKDQSTDLERVRCTACQSEFSLTELPSLEQVIRTPLTF